jgi:hypothetical protein
MTQYRKKVNIANVAEGITRLSLEIEKSEVKISLALKKELLRMLQMLQ